MRVRLLGTGSADRWPNPWCRCPRCQWARQSGQHRDRTSALVDDVLLIDPGPDAGRGADLAEVGTVLITHDHPDHLDPAFLLAWAWAGAASSPPARDMAAASSDVGRGPEAAQTDVGRGRGAAQTGVGRDWGAAPLLVAGPPDALDRCRDWVAPDAPVAFLPLAAGELLQRGEHVIRALPAAHSVLGGRDHDGTALLYDVTGPDARLLYATDTAALPHDVLAERYDLVLLELTFGDAPDHGTAHLDLAGFGHEVAHLRRAGRLDAGSRVIAVHLSHHNPIDLPERLSGVGAEVLADGTEVVVGAEVLADGTEVVVGAEVLADGTEVVVGAAASLGGDGVGASRARARASLGDDDGGALPYRRRTLLVTGGARSGKSARAEALLAGRPSVRYVATAPDQPGDPEWAARVAAHQARRPAGWVTHESRDLAGIIGAAEPGEAVLVDCLALWVTALVDAADAWSDRHRAERTVESAVAGLVEALAVTGADVVLVTNEVGSGVVPATASGRLFQDLLGRVNARVAAACDSVELVTCGIPTILKGTAWPTST